MILPREAELRTLADARPAYEALVDQAHAAREARRWAEARDVALVAADMAEERGAPDLARHGRNFARRMHAANFAQRVYGDNFLYPTALPRSVRGQREWRTFLLVLRPTPQGRENVIRVRVLNSGKIIVE